MEHGAYSLTNPLHYYIILLSADLVLNTGMYDATSRNVME